MSLFSLDEVKALSEQSSPGNAAVPVKDIFAEKQRAGWHKPDDKALEARCDLSVERMTMTPHASIPVLSIWKKSISIWAHYRPNRTLSSLMILLLPALRSMPCIVYLNPSARTCSLSWA